MNSWNAKYYHNQLSKSLVRWIDINQCHLFVGTRYRGGRLEPNSFTGIKVCHFSRGTVCCNSNWCQNVMHFKLVLVYNISITGPIFTSLPPTRKRTQVPNRPFYHPLLPYIQSSLPKYQKIYFVIFTR